MHRLFVLCAAATAAAAAVLLLLMSLVTVRCITELMAVLRGCPTGTRVGFLALGVLLSYWFVVAYGGLL